MHAQETLDIEGAAAFLHIHKVTALEMAAAGILPGAKIGRAWVFLKDDLAAYVREEARRQQFERLGQKQQPNMMAMKESECQIPPRQDSRRRRPLPVLPELPPTTSRPPNSSREG